MKNLYLLILTALMLACSPEHHEQSHDHADEKNEHGSNQEHLISKTSSKSSKEVIDSLKSGIEKRGLSIFTEIPHHRGAEKVDMELPTTQVIIFGNPKVGTKLMICDQRIGYELPLKILVMENNEGVTSINYIDPKTYANKYKMEDCQGILDKVSAMLDGLTNDVI